MHRISPLPPVAKMDEASPDMTIYTNREESFQGCWPHQDSTSLTSSSMADAGFFYLGKDDEVECHVCGVRIRAWEKNDTPTDQHHKYSPDCPTHAQDLFLHKRTTSNPSHTTRHCNIHSPSYNSQNVLCNSIRAPSSGDSGKCVQDTPDSIPSNYDRLKTFLNNNWPSTSPVLPAELAEAGLYYVGPGDTVQCSRCGGKLDGWKAGDTAEGRHRGQYPNCVSLMDASCSVTEENAGSVQTTMEALLHATHKGYERAVIQEAQFQLYLRASDVTTASLQREIDKILQTRDQEAGSSTHLESQLRSLSLKTKREADMCSVCGEKEADQCCWPCRHQVTCEACARHQDTCPACQTRVNKWRKNSKR